MPPEFDQRPGELEATRGPTRVLPLVAITHDAGAESRGRAVLICEALEVVLTPAQMRALGRNLIWSADLIAPEDEAL